MYSANAWFDSGYMRCVSLQNFLFFYVNMWITDLEVEFSSCSLFLYTAHCLVRPWIHFLRQSTDNFTFFYVFWWITDPEVDSRLSGHVFFALGMRTLFSCPLYLVVTCSCYLPEEYTVASFPGDDSRNGFRIQHSSWFNRRIHVRRWFTCMSGRFHRCSRGKTVDIPQLQPVDAWPWLCRSAGSTGAVCEETVEIPLLLLVHAGVAVH